MNEPREVRIKRMRMRAWRRGTKEMDIVLGPFADERLAGMDAPELDAFDALLAENDQDLLQWVLGQTTPPAAHVGLVAELGLHARARLSDGAND